MDAGANTPNKKSPLVKGVELLSQKRVSETVFIFVSGNKTLQRCERYYFFLSKGGGYISVMKGGYISVMKGSLLGLCCRHSRQ